MSAVNLTSSPGRASMSVGSTRKVTLGAISTTSLTVIGAIVTWLAANSTLTSYPSRLRGVPGSMSGLGAKVWISRSSVWVALESLVSNTGKLIIREAALGVMVTVLILISPR